MDRYIYAVTQRLPEQQRAEIKQELRGLIEDMLEERVPAGRASREDVESVLLELGHPSKLAAKYRGYDRYLIGPLTLESYLTTLKIVLVSIALSLTVVFVIDMMVTPSAAMEDFVKYIVSMLNTGAQGFAWVTIIFALIDYSRQKDGIGSSESNDEQINGSWRPSDLPQIPDVESEIKISEPITGIIFTVLFVVVYLYKVEWLGVWRFDEGERFVIPILNAEVSRNYFPVVGVLAALGILKESVRIIFRRRSAKMLAFHITMSIVSTALLYVVLSDSAIWNSEFIQQMVDAGILTVGEEAYDTLTSIWAGVTNDWMIIIIGLALLIDIISETYRWYRAKASA